MSTCQEKYIRLLFTVLFLSALIFGYHALINMSSNSIVVIETVNNTNVSHHSNASDKRHLEDYSPVVIDGNGDFKQQALNINWPGNGTESHPYIISNLFLTTSDYLQKCISISNTDSYFTITNCTLQSSSSYSIFLNNVTNGIITGNRIFYGDQDGIFTIYSSNISIISNDVSYQANSGIRVSLSNNIVVEKNTVNNCAIGIETVNSLNISIVENEISSNQHGMVFNTADNCSSVMNRISSNAHLGLSLTDSEHNMVMNNDFISNNGGNTPQAGDYWQGESVTGRTSTNNITSNYWDDWIEPDSDEDGIVDVPYSIDGLMDNKDLLPLVNPVIAITSSSQLPVSGMTAFTVLLSACAIMMVKRRKH